MYVADVCGCGCSLRAFFNLERRVAAHASLILAVAAPPLCVADIPVFYMFKALIKKPAPVQNADGELVAPEPRSPLQIAKTALLTYKKNFVEDNYSMCALLIPGDILTFAAPMWLRMPANHLISFMWVCYLSFLRGAEDVAQ